MNNLTNDHFTVAVDHALVGCTNGASIVVYEDPTTLWLKYRLNTKDDKAKYMPTNNSRIVFSVYTNDYGKLSSFKQRVFLRARRTGTCTLQ